MSLYNKAKGLREERMAIIAEQRKILDTARDAGRKLTAEEDQRWDKAETDVRELDEQIESTERELAKQEGKRAKLDELQSRLGDMPAEERARLPIGDERESRDAEVVLRSLKAKRSAALKRWAAGGADDLTPEDRSILQFGNMRHGAPGRGVQMGDLRETEEFRAQSTADGSGGEMIAEDFYQVMTDAMLSYSGVMQAATILPTATGATLPMPTSDDTGQTGELLGENTQAASQDVSTSSVDLGAYMFSSKIIRCSFQLLQDSAFDFESWINGKLAERIGRILESYFTTGTGTAQPNGIVTAAASGHVAASTSAITFDEVLELKHAVDPAYRAVGGAFMFHDSTLKALKQLSIGSADARPLWQPGVAVGEPDTIDGDPYYINQQMAELDDGVSSKVMLYGNLSSYMVRQVRGVQILRLEERYADYLQVGFLGFARYDGDLLDAGTNPVKFLALAAS